MSGALSLSLLLGGLIALLLWLFLGRGARQDQPAETEEAEDEVRDLDAFTTPEDADDELPDWGPGTPNP